MENSQIGEIVEAAISNLSRVAEVNTIIGKPIVMLDGTTIMPISQISFAFMAGGGEYGNKMSSRRLSRFEPDSKFAGGTGGGAQLTPVGFLVVDSNGVRVIHADKDNLIDKVLDTARGFFDEKN